jgi:C-terminal processing protease CtpA/Prc
MKKLIFCLLSIACLTAFYSCKDKDDDIDNPSGIDKDILKVNEFVANIFDELYLWVDDIDMATFKKTYNQYDDPFDFFEKLRYKDDKWSVLTDDIEGMKGDFQGVSTSYGWQLIRGKFSNTNTYFSIVLFVYPDSPAEKAGIKRGDIIIKADGEDLTDANYGKLGNSRSITINKGILDNNSIREDSKSISLNAVEMYNNPVNKDTIIVKGQHRIGYLCYTEFMDKSEKDLENVFSNFKRQGVTDVVLDLRYNPGGYVSTAIYLSSILAPKTTIDNKEIFQIQVWNNLQTQVNLKDGDDMTEHFIGNIPVNMNLSRLYVITTEFTASASEATIIGLAPFMDIAKIGSVTSGKFVGGGLISVENLNSSMQNYYKDIKNWGMYIMAFRYTNKDETYFTSGLEPDIEAKEDYFALRPFGDENDPLLGVAIAQITGVPYTKSLVSKSPRNYEMDKELTIKSPVYGKLIDKKRF